MVSKTSPFITLAKTDPASKTVEGLKDSTPGGKTDGQLPVLVQCL